MYKTEESLLRKFIFKYHFFVFVICEHYAGVFVAYGERKEGGGGRCRLCRYSNNQFTSFASSQGRQRRLILTEIYSARKLFHLKEGLTRTYIQECLI